ncbi:hypothetical protein [Kitasatospora sp. NPDC001175]|uniref:hypothetical protein n=1 Tax=Kitasatospora sp. NPDC001175 TaxID=3157103 RepID=UPI003D07C36E
MNTPSTDNLPVVVEIEGITAPATFTRLPDALTAVWDALKLLPLGTLQADAFRYFLTRPDAAERTTEFLRRDGRLDLSFTLHGRTHAVRLRPQLTES